MNLLKTLPFKTAILKTQQNCRKVILLSLKLRYFKDLWVFKKKFKKNLKCCSYNLILMSDFNSQQQSSYRDIVNERLNGRWTYEEHQLFLQGLKKYGKNWKKIETVVKTRTGSQIRSHAQKFFSKLNLKTKEQSLQFNSHSLDGKYEQSSATTFQENTVETIPSTAQILNQLKQTLTLIQQSNVNPLKLFSYHFFQLMKRPQQLIDNNFYKHFVDFSGKFQQIYAIQSLSENLTIPAKTSFISMKQIPIVPLLLNAQMSICGNTL